MAPYEALYEAVATLREVAEIVPQKFVAKIKTG
jgi:hypothetical protein